MCWCKVEVSLSPPELDIRGTSRQKDLFGFVWDPRSPKQCLPREWNCWCQRKLKNPWIHLLGHLPPDCSHQFFQQCHQDNLDAASFLKSIVNGLGYWQGSDVWVWSQLSSWFFWPWRKDWKQQLLPELLGWSAGFCCILHMASILPHLNKATGNKWFQLHLGRNADSFSLGKGCFWCSKISFFTVKIN